MEGKIRLDVCERDSYNLLSATLLFSQSFDKCSIARYFFGSDTLTFSGSAVGSRGDNDILADYFGLPPDFSSTVSFSPFVCTFSCDLMWRHIVLNGSLRGLSFHVYAPIVHTRWDLGINEWIQSEGSQGYIAGYMASQTVDRSELYNSVSEALCCTKEIGDIKPLAYGKICGKQTRTRLSDIKCVLGYAFLQNNRHHLAVNARVLLPTGNRSNAEYLFEPMVGNGHHWGLGFGVTGNKRLWCNDGNNKRFDIYADLNVTHLFSARQRRSFDFIKNGPLSRYMLIQSMGKAIVGELNFDTQPDPTPMENQYLGKLMPAINKTTFDVDINIAAQIEFSIKGCFQINNCNVEVGYNLWHRTAEKLKRRACLPSSCFAIKGDALIYGYYPINNAKFFAINATQSCATIHKGQGEMRTSASEENINVDNASFIHFDEDENLTVENPDILEVNASNQAILLTDCDINNNSGVVPQVTSHTLFLHMNYDWNREKSAVPFLGWGASVELDGNSKDESIAIPMWAVWIKGGVCW